MSTREAGKGFLLKPSVAAVATSPCTWGLAVCNKWRWPCKTGRRQVLLKACNMVRTCEIEGNQFLKFILDSVFKKKATVTILTLKPWHSAWHSEQPLCCCASLFLLCQFVLRCIACVHVQVRPEVRYGRSRSSQAKQANDNLCALNWTFVSHKGEVLRCASFNLSGVASNFVLSFCTGSNDAFWTATCICVSLHFLESRWQRQQHDGADVSYLAC